MLIEQIIEFEWREPRPPGRTCTPITAYLHDKTKISKENVRVNDYLVPKYGRKQRALLPFNRAKSLTKSSAKM